MMLLTLSQEAPLLPVPTCTRPGCMYSEAIKLRPPSLGESGAPSAMLQAWKTISSPRALSSSWPPSSAASSGLSDAARNVRQPNRHPEQAQLDPLPFVN